MGLKYWRFGAVALTVVFILSMAGAGVVLAADPAADLVVRTGVVTVHWVDADHGPMGGATVRISWYRHPGDVDEVHGFVPGAWITNSDGVVVISGVPRPIVASDPILLDIRGDLDTRTLDAAGCVSFESWLAETDGITSEFDLDVVLHTSTTSLQLNCPEPTPTRTPAGGAIDPPATPSTTPAGGVLGATARPRVTPPSTDTAGVPAVTTGSPFVPYLLGLVGVALFLVPAGSLAFARAQSRPRRRD